MRTCPWVCSACSGRSSCGTLRVRCLQFKCSTSVLKYYFRTFYLDLLHYTASTTTYSLPYLLFYRRFLSH